ncbi:MAG: SGNH/GDSL hydrolase family protein [Candidatus Paceibacterota bacterium]
MVFSKRGATIKIFTNRPVRGDFMGIKFTNNWGEVTDNTEQVAEIAQHDTAIDNWKLDLVNMFGTSDLVALVGSSGMPSTDPGDTPVMLDLAALDSSAPYLKASFNVTDGHSYLFCVKEKCTSYGSGSVFTSIDPNTDSSTATAAKLAVNSYFSTSYNGHGVNSSGTQAGSTLYLDSYQCLGQILTATSDGILDMGYSINQAAKDAVIEYSDLIMVDITDRLTTDMVEAIINGGYFANTKTIYRNKNVIPLKSSLSDKKIVLVGDSITEGQRTTLTDFDTLLKPTFGALIAQRNNMKYRNYGRQGWLLTHRDGQTNGFSDADGLYTQLDTDADYILIMYGINDAGQSATVGTSADTTNVTFYGAWDVVLNYLITNHATAKIGIIIPPAFLNLTYRTAIRAMGVKYAIPILDTWADNVPLIYNKEPESGIPAAITTARQGTFLNVDGTHLNDAGHAYFSTIVENFVKSL